MQQLARRAASQHTASAAMTTRTAFPIAEQVALMTPLPTELDACCRWTGGP
jgi:hypothetical protein